MVVALLLCSNAGAAIYRWVDENGHVQFSDRWSQGSEQLATPRVVEEESKERTEPEALPAEPPPPDEPFLGPYTTLEIVAPAANETLTQDDAGIAVSLMIDPALIEGAQLSVLLDDSALPVKNGATQFKLTGAALGSHRLQIRVKDAGGRILAQSAPQSFHIRKPKEPGQLP